jgi:hypothetical protein
LDRYRIQALAKLLAEKTLSPSQQKFVLEAMEQKCRIYSAGCRKRGRYEEAESFRQLPKRLAREQNLEWYL